MSEFVEQCRREWRRLGVPSAVAEEMAADLASDLLEAQGEGVSAEAFLGDSFLDPRAFAASWAAERGIIPEPRARRSARRRTPVLVAFTALATAAVIVTALLLATGEPKVALVASRPPHPNSLSTTGALPHRATRQVVASASAAAPIEWILLLLATVALGFAAWSWANSSRSRPSSSLV